MPAPTITPEVAPKTNVLPDSGICSTAPLEMGIHWGNCLVGDSLGCRYAKDYGGIHHICTHPKWYEFIKQ